MSGWQPPVTVNPVAVERTIWFTPEGASESIPGWREIRVWCQGCTLLHPFRIWLDPKMHKRNDGSDYPTWSWNGSLTSPSFEPSLLVHNAFHLCEDQHVYTECTQEFSECGHGSHGYAWVFPDGSQRRFKTWEEKPEEARQIKTGGPSPHPLDPAWGNCHSFLRNGVWEFLGDCAHALRGFHPLQPLPDWYIKEGE